MTRDLRPGTALDERITGAIIDSVEIGPAGFATLTFRHRGTDDDSGQIVVHPSAITFAEDESDA